MVGIESCSKEVLEDKFATIFFKEILAKCNGITDDELGKILESYAQDEEEYDELYYVMKLLFK